MTAPTLNGLEIVSVRVSIPWRGAWLADVELPGDAAVPSGACVLGVGGLLLPGAVDPRGTGQFAGSVRVRVVGGGGGWDKPVPAQHFADPGGNLLSTLVYSTTAAAVGETVVEVAPQVLGGHFARVAGPASRVFGARDWHIDPVSGVTSLAAWLPSVLATDATITDWAPDQQRANIASTTLILPGTVLADPRFHGAAFVVRDVEQTFSREGASAEVWCAANPSSRLRDALTSMVREFGETAYLRTYKYRFVLAVGGKLAIQAVTAGAPDLNPIEQWTGLSGAQAKLAPATEIVVGFIGGDPTQPFLVSFSPLATPIEVDLAGGANYLVPAPWAAALAAALATFASSLTVVNLSGNAAALSNALTQLPPATTVLTKAT